MKIDRNNYEAYFLDYTEGKLSTAEIAVLMAFVLGCFLATEARASDLSGLYNRTKRHTTFKGTTDTLAQNLRNSARLSTTHRRQMMGFLRQWW